MIKECYLQCLCILNKAHLHVYTLINNNWSQFLQYDPLKLLLNLVMSRYISRIIFSIVTAMTLCQN